MKYDSNYGKIIEKYSVFSLHQIDHSLISLMNIFEEQKYIYQKDIKNGTVKIIGEDEEYKIKTSGILKFYTYDTFLKRNYNLGKFDYLYDFIDMLIETKIKNKTNFIKDADIERTKILFIAQNTSKIEERCKLKEEEYNKILKQKLKRL